ncbi:MAG: chalcone isomerase family protein [Planctomycetes bacterium]|nr:chalcone isomerase family protein [Planctomycetota bacterium]
MTSGFVGRASLVSSLEEGLARSNKGNTSAYKREIEQLQQMLRDEVKRNDVYDFVYVPNKGLHVLKNGKSQGVIPGLEFKQAFYGIWLSDTPVDKDLRQAMLSGKSGSY